MKPQEMVVETILSQVGRADPQICGSTASLVAGLLGTAMARLALAVSGKHGERNDQAIERLDSLVADIKEATDRDYRASAALIDAYLEEADDEVCSRALADATRQPLSAAQLLVELLEHLNGAEHCIHRLVESDFFGGVELISAAFTAVMMAVANNVLREDAGRLRERTAKSRSGLSRRHEVVMTALRSKSSARARQLQQIK